MTTPRARIATAAERTRYGAGVWMTYEGAPNSALAVAVPATIPRIVQPVPEYRVRRRIEGAKMARLASVPTSSERLATRGHASGSGRHAENMEVRMPKRSQGAIVASNPTANSEAAVRFGTLETCLVSVGLDDAGIPTSRVAHSVHRIRPRTGTAHGRHAGRPQAAHRSTASRSGWRRQDSLLAGGASASTVLDSAGLTAPTGRPYGAAE
jgi:hypothetical protein